MSFFTIREEQKHRPHPFKFDVKTNVSHGCLSNGRNSIEFFV
jgi:hypothetical protein